MEKEMHFDDVKDVSDHFFCSVKHRQMSGTNWYQAQLKVVYEDRRARQDMLHMEVIALLKILIKNVLNFR
jgi:hypothetical protein